MPAGSVSARHQSADTGEEPLPGAHAPPATGAPGAAAAAEPELRHGWIVSLLFWLTLLAAAILYSLVALSPPMETGIELHRQEKRNQFQLVYLERQVRYLGQVVEALHNDPEFARELARVEFDAGSPGYERLPVDPHLSLDARPARQQLPPDLDEQPWYIPILIAFGQRGAARQNALFVSVGLILFAFTFLHESQARQLWNTVCRVRGGIGTFFSRYKVDPPPEEEEEEEEWEEVLLRRRVKPEKTSRS